MAKKKIRSPLQPAAGCRVGFVKSARKVYDALPQRERDALEKKLRQVAENPRLAKPLVGELAGCARITYGRIRCVARLAEGQAVILVLVIAKRKHGDKSDPYAVATSMLREQPEEIAAVLQQHVISYVEELAQH